jgi:hypothetical protein
MVRTPVVDITGVLSGPLIPSGLTRARRTAATARASMGVAGLVLVLEWPPAGISAVLAEIGFGVILVTSIVQLLAPRQEWMQVEETLASIAGVLIIGFGPAAVTPLTLLWLTALASGVLARGGRAHWIGRAVLLVALAMPIVRYQTVSPRWTRRSAWR